MEGFVGEEEVFIDDAVVDWEPVELYENRGDVVR